MAPHRLLPTRTRRLRMLAHTRRLMGVILPLGAVTGLLVALAVHGLEIFSERAREMGGHRGWEVLLPCAGLGLVTWWLTWTRIGEVSLFDDMALAQHQPYAAFPFRRTLAKVAGCGLTIGLGGSTGVEGPGKWFGGAMGLQCHRLTQAAARRLAFVRRAMSPSVVMVRAGAAAALGAIFRAPLCGALMAAEHDGHLSSASLIPCLVASASGFLAFSGWLGLAPLLPLTAPFQPGFREIVWAVALGVSCGILANAFLAIKARLRIWLDPIPFRWRGWVAGLGLVLLAVPGRWLWHGLPVTQGGGLDLVAALLHGGTPAPTALAFMALKLLATALTLAGGGIGGTWLPSVAMGAAIGAAWEGVLGVGAPGCLTLVGASAFAGATHQTLLVPVVFLAETTGQAGLVVPALVATTLAYLAVREHE